MLRWSLAALALLGSLWTVVVWLTGGFTLSIAGVRLSSTNPVRPLIAAAVAAAAYVVYSGPARTRADLGRLHQGLRPARVAAIVAVAAVLVALSDNSWTAGGPDAYSYVTQADLWLHRDLKVSMPLAEALPWPNGLATLTPLGYRSIPQEAAIVPVTPPGLPMMMAVLKWIGGHCAAFWVVPLTAGLLVWATFSIGRRVASEVIGVGAAWLVATSPTFLALSKAPMSDVPAAAFWAQATAWILGDSLLSAVAAGISASLAILIRPNLVPLAGVMAAWLLWRHRSELPIPKSPTPKKRFGGWGIGSWESVSAGRALGFVAGTLPGCLAVAWFNWAVYGSPLESGYGDLNALFSVAHVPTNLTRYGRWLIETQTPLAVIGMVALVMPLRRVWPTDESRRNARLLAFITLVVWALYCVYIPFEAWWFLRFLLPCWPAICIGTAAVTVRLLDGERRWRRNAAVVALIGLGVYGVLVAVRRDVFPAGEGERRYATIAKLVERATEPSSTILTVYHAGPIRYYAGRLTLRFDLLDEMWLDRAIDWLHAQGRRPYILLEDWELPAFEGRFAGKNRLGRLDLAPVLAYRAYAIPGTIYLFDPLRPGGPTWDPPPMPNPRPRCVPPALP